jgi:hypothetical protein
VRQAWGNGGGDAMPLELDWPVHMTAHDPEDLRVRLDQRSQRLPAFAVLDIFDGWK